MKNPKVSIMDRQSRPRKSKQNPKVSIIIPVYNGSNFVREAIASALAQTYKNTEVIVVNDGSTDGGETDKICKSFGTKIRYFKKINGKVSTALNLGIKKMTGEYFSWLSHDDLYTPDKIKKQVDFILKCSPRTLVYSNYEVINAPGQRIGYSKWKPVRKSNLIRVLMEDRFMHGCALLIPKSGFAEVGLFNPKLLNTQDFDLWFRFMDKGYDFRLCPGLLVKSRRHNQQDSVTTSDRQMVEEDILYFKVLEHFPAKRLFLGSKNLSLDYINMAFSNKIIGLIKTAEYAYELSQKYLTKKTYLAWFWRNLRYRLWFKSYSNIVKFLIQWARRAKRLFMNFTIKKPVSLLVKSPNVPVYILLIGNVQSCHNQKLLKFLTHENYKISFISTRVGNYTGVKVYEIARKFYEPKAIWFFRFLWLTKKIIWQTKPDIIQGQSLTPGGIAAWSSGFHPYIAGIWGSDVLEFDLYPLILKSWLKKTLIDADYLIGNSLILKDAAIRIGADARKFHLIRFGVDVGIFKPKSDARIRRKLKLKDEKIIFCPRAIEPLYNTMILVEAFANIVNKGNYKLALVDWSIDKSYSEVIKTYIKQNRLIDKVIFLPQVENSKMVDYFNLAEVVVSIPNSDSVSVSLLEAMACEKKIVVSDLPYPKIWKKNQFGFKNLWVTKINVIKVGQTLLRALNTDKKEFASMTRVNRELVKKEANLKTSFQPLVDLYEQILK